MFSANMPIVQPPRFISRQFNSFLGVRRQADFARSGLITLAQRSLDRLARYVHVHIQPFQHRRRATLAFAEQPQQYMPGADVALVESDRLFIRPAEYLPGALSELDKVISCLHGKHLRVEVGVLRLLVSMLQ